MSLQWPSLLWLLFLIPVLVLAYLWMLRRRRRFAARYASLLVVKDALGKGPGFRRHVPVILFLTGLAIGIFALSRPQATVTLPSNRGTVILAIDESGSMRAHDIKPSRIEAAKAAAHRFVEKEPRRVRVGIVAFAGTAALVQAPTTNKEDLYAAIDRLYTQRATAIGSGILVSLGAIFEDEKRAQEDASGQAAGANGPDPNGQGQQDPSALPNPDQPLGTQQDQAPQPAPVAPGSYDSAAIILLTDGQSNTGPDPLDAAQQAADRGVRVFTVGIGTTRGDIVGMEGRSFRVALDEDTLKKIAHNTAASYFKASDEGELMRIYDALSVRLVMGKDQT
ncbi:MAG TPA: VWA domain-containing protein, partial [Spirochaetia bacterium]|nr:VWA domain-containing protein [Spirochaetia bacterium]